MRRIVGLLFLVLVSLAVLVSAVPFTVEMKDSYQLGELVTIRVRGENGRVVAIQVNSPRGLYCVNQATIKNGVVVFKFRIPYYRILTGKWTVYIVTTGYMVVKHFTVEEEHSTSQSPTSKWTRHGKWFREIRRYRLRRHLWER